MTRSSSRLDIVRSDRGLRLIETDIHNDCATDETPTEATCPDCDDSAATEHCGRCGQTGRVPFESMTEAEQRHALREYE